MEESNPPPAPGSPGPPAPKGSAWPKTVGIIAIIFGILGAGGAVIAPLSLAFTKTQMQVYVEMGAKQETVDEYLERLSGISILNAVIIGILGVVLLIGGILLLKQNSKSPWILKSWAIAKMAAGLYTTMVNMSLTKMQMGIITSSSTFGEDGEMINQFANVGAIVGAVFGLLWIAALPAFLLIWFSRPKVKADIASWET